MSWCPTEAKTPTTSRKLSCWNMLQRKRSQPNIRLECSGTICRALKHWLFSNLQKSRKLKSTEIPGDFEKQDKSFSQILLERRWQCWFPEQIKWVSHWTGSQLDHYGMLQAPGVGAAGTGGQNSGGGGGGRCPAPVLASNNQGAPLGAGTAPQPLHFISLRQLPLLSFFHFHFSLLSMNNLLRQDACAASLCLARGSHFSSCTTIYLGGRNQFQHLSFWASNLWFSPGLCVCCELN